MPDDAGSPDGDASGSTTQDAEPVQAPQPADTPPVTEDAGGDAAAEPEVVVAEEETAAPMRARWRPRPALVAGLIGVVALSGLVGWLGLRTYQSRSAQADVNLFLDGGRQGAADLTTVDYAHVDADVQRILAATTGTFHDNFAKRSQIYIAAVKDAQSKSVGTVSAAGLESRSGDEAQVVVAVTVTTSSAALPEQPPQAWRMRLTVQKVGDATKVAKVEFVQ
ncbi:Mce protein [Mycobacterium sp. pUA109]|uniref:Mce protein n=1 Tax=Mycobacterium sp. pUA109 TaxID=3238982 RepID=UPI00351BA629